LGVVCVKNYEIEATLYSVSDICALLATFSKYQRHLVNVDTI